MKIIIAMTLMFGTLAHAQTSIMGKNKTVTFEENLITHSQGYHFEGVTLQSTALKGNISYTGNPSTHTLNIKVSGTFDQYDSDIKRSQLSNIGESLRQNREELEADTYHEAGMYAKLDQPGANPSQTKVAIQFKSQARAEAFRKLLASDAVLDLRIIHNCTVSADSSTNACSPRDPAIHPMESDISLRFPHEESIVNLSDYLDGKTPIRTNSQAPLKRTAK